jgi:hypothetical protein
MVKSSQSMKNRNKISLEYMVLPNDVLEIIAGFADIDARRALGFPPKHLTKEQLDVSFVQKKPIFFNDPHIVMTVCGEKSFTTIKIIHPEDNRPFQVNVSKTIWGGPKGTNYTSEIFFLK